MNIKPGVLVLLVISSGTGVMTATASEIYRQVDEEGVVHFTDQPAPEAKAVEVNPNVIEVAPIKPLEPLPKKPDIEPQKPQPITAPEEVRHTLDEDDFYYDGNVRKRRLLIKEHLQNGKQPVQLPVQRPVTQPVPGPVRVQPR